MNLIQKIAWYGRRLSVMDSAEIAHRVFEQLTILKFRIRYALQAGHKRSVPIDYRSVSFCRQGEQRFRQFVEIIR